MNIGIYKGSIIKYILISPKVVCFNVDGDECSVGIDHIVQVPKDAFQEVEAELQAIRNEVSAIKERMIKLDDAYQSKKEYLRNLMTEARSKELSIASKLIRLSQQSTSAD